MSAPFLYRVILLQRAEFVGDSPADGPRLQVPSSPKSYRPDADRIASDVSRKACEPHALSSGKSAAVRCGRTYPRHRGARLLHRADFDAGRIIELTVEDTEPGTVTRISGEELTIQQLRRDERRNVTYDYGLLSPAETTTVVKKRKLVG